MADLTDDGGEDSDSVWRSGGEGVAPWLADLNDAQSRAVEHLDGPLLVLSGAGTGKTRVLTSRLVQLMATDTAKPWNILAVTFTNKAAREMKDRVAQIIGSAVEQIWFGTFHSLAARILRRHAELVGLSSNFTILDTDDQLRLIKQLMEAGGLDIKSFPPRAVLAIISRWKDKGLTPEQVNPAQENELAEGTGEGFYHHYQDRLRALNACDFGDLLLHNLTIFNAHPDILAEYHNRITHFLVDEYQDSNVAQYLWLRLLAQQSRNICCVGDDDQSIYGWRGAEITNMLKFQEIYPEAEVIRLEQNYRSTGHILEAASSLISHNEGRLGKSLYTSIDKGEQISVSGFWDGRSEASDVADRIGSLVRSGDVSYNEVSVLVRAGFQTREFEERFVKVGLPYRVVGARFYERQEIRDAVAYLRVIAQPSDDLAFERIVNTPRRGIGDTTVEIVRRHAPQWGVSMLSSAERLVASEGELKTAAKRSLGGLVDLFSGWREARGELSHTQLVIRVLDESGYMEMWRQEKTPDAEGRVENLKELVVAMENFDNLEAFLEHISLVMDGDSAGSDGEVTLMTLHAAKGLEFDVVFLPGWEDGIFPSPLSLDEKGGAGLEEERRLAYVGLTRARRRIFISYASSRRIHGLWQSTMPSRFLSELPEENVVERIESGMMSSASRRQGTGVNLFRASPISGYDTEGYDAGGYDIGDRVFHQKFGNGEVRSTDGDKLDVWFDKAGVKKVVAGFVTLVKRGDER